jgi:ATP-dependent helicase/DNAse subunit B
MDPSEDKARLCGYLKDGQPRGDLADRDQLKQLEKYVYHVLAKMVEDIASGNVEANPYTRGSVHNACTFCPYGAVCHKDTVPGRRNYKSVTAKEFWERVGKELENHG